MSTTSGQRLAAKGDRPEITWTFTVLDSQETNAFALPGGYIYITRGIMSYLNSEAEPPRCSATRSGTSRRVTQCGSRPAPPPPASGQR